MNIQTFVCSWPAQKPSGWCVVLGIWVLGFGIWPFCAEATEDADIWVLGFGIWPFCAEATEDADIWILGFGFWNLVFGPP